MTPPIAEESRPHRASGTIDLLDWIPAGMAPDTHSLGSKPASIESRLLVNEFMAFANPAQLDFHNQTELVPVAAP